LIKWLIPHRPINNLLVEAEDLEEDLDVEDVEDVVAVEVVEDVVENVVEREEEVVRDVEEGIRMKESGSLLPNLDDSSKTDSSRSWKIFSCFLFPSRSIRLSTGSWAPRSRMRS
jgi:hypothetical protein